MSNNKFEDYPEWGAFGGPSAEDEARWQQTKDESYERGDGCANGGATVHLVTEVIINNATGETTFRVKSEAGDTPGQAADGREWIDRKQAEHAAQLKTAQNKKLLAADLALSGRRDAMAAVIESAMKEALDCRDLHSVWATMVAMATHPNPPAPLLGVTDDGSAIKCRGRERSDGLFTMKMLKGC